MTEESNKFLKKSDGKKINSNATRTVFEKGTTGEQIVNFWISELQKAIDANKQTARPKKE